jgi:hypothetical protein
MLYKILKYDSFEEVQYETTLEWGFPLSLSRWFTSIYVFIVLSPVLNDVITGIRSLQCIVDIY